MSYYPEGPVLLTVWFIRDIVKLAEVAEQVGNMAEYPKLKSTQPRFAKR